MYRVTFKCGICNEKFTVDVKQLLDALKEASDNGCKKCNEKDIDPKKRKIFLLKHDIIDDKGNIVEPEIIQHEYQEYTWASLKRDLEAPDEEDFTFPFRI